MKIVCISDTHNLHWDLKVPEGDLLIVAGDISGRGTMPEVLGFNKWLETLSHPHKVVIAGNHDFGFEREPSLFRSLITNATYLQNEETEIEGLKIWGSPVTPWFFNWAFNVPRSHEIAAIWARIPEDTDILITHGPPFGILDELLHDEPVGCEALAERVAQIQPRLHVFGHIHEAAGRLVKEWPSGKQTTFINASQLDRQYRPNGNIQVVEL